MLTNRTFGLLSATEKKTSSDVSRILFGNRNSSSHHRIATDYAVVDEFHAASRFPRRRRRVVAGQRLPRQRRRAEGVAADDELHSVGGRASDERRHLVTVHVSYLRGVYLQFTHATIAVISLSAAATSKKDSKKCSHLVGCVE